MQRHSLTTTTIRSMPSQSPSNGYVGKNSSPLPAVSLLSMMPCDMEYLFGHFGSVAPAVSNLGVLPSPHVLTERLERNKEGVHFV